MPRRDREAKRKADLSRILLKSERDRDIAGDYPERGDMDRRAACARDFGRFLRVYFPAAVPLEFSDDHRRVIAHFERVVLEGGLVAVGMPRASGKTTLALRACLWALLYGHRRFVVLVAATDKRARELLGAIKAELVGNDLLAADFRQVCHAFRKLGGSARRASGQLFEGKPTEIGWKADRIVFPRLPESALDGPDVGGAVVAVAGLTSSIRGQQHTLADGRVLRPDLAVVDDPSTRESAASPSQNSDRLAVVNADVLGMAGPGERIAGICACTIIYPDDLSAQLLDRKRSPRWNGECCKMVYAFPEAESRWEEYRRLRDEVGEAVATAYYGEHQVEMDLGAVIGWPARFNPGQLSAVQHAMDLKFDDEQVFNAEYQNDPAPPGGAKMLQSPEALAARVNGVPRGVVPLGCEHLTAAIDVHDDVLFYCVTAWSPEFRGAVVQHGTWPDQGRLHFVKRKAAKTLARAYPGAGREGAIRAGLLALIDDLMGREWPREDGSSMHVGLAVLDAGYVPDVVHDVVKHSPHAARLKPSRGVGITASGRPMTEYDRTQGDRIGHHWILARPTAPGAPRHMRYDSNYWKSFVHARLASPLGDTGALSFYGQDAGPHRLFSEHLVAERPIRTHGQGREVDEWKLLPSKPDNHWLDVLAAATTAASFLGAVLPGSGAIPKKKREYISFAERRRRIREQSPGWKSL